MGDDMGKANELIKTLICILIGTFVLALGINIFLVPNKISSGGVSTFGTILLYICGIKMSATNILINMLLFFLGYKYLGKETVLKTVVGIIALTLSLEITSLMPTFGGNLVLSSILGGIFVGLGVGIVVRERASTGGSDFLALVLKRFLPHISLANIILFIDTIIIILAGIVFKSLSVTLYSIFSMYISSLFTNLVLSL